MTALPGYALALLVLLNGAALAGPVRLAAQDGRIVAFAADGGRRVLSAGPEDRAPVLSPDGRQGAFLRPEGKTEAVSYTHLDVYKRQLWDDVLAVMAHVAERSSADRFVKEFRLMLDAV